MDLSSQKVLLHPAIFLPIKSAFILESISKETSAFAIPSSSPSGSGDFWSACSEPWIRHDLDQWIHPDFLFWESRSPQSVLEDLISPFTKLFIKGSTMEGPEPTFTVCGCFSGKGAISAANIGQKRKGRVPKLEKPHMIFHVANIIGVSFPFMGKVYDRLTRRQQIENT